MELSIAAGRKNLKSEGKASLVKCWCGNNKQFYQAARLREVRNSIREIKRGDGSIVSTQDEIKREANANSHGGGE